MSALPHITVLMGTRNGATYLHQQLASLAAQDHPNWSLWVSDDGSTDATRATLRAFAAGRRNPVLLLPGPQRGLSANYLTLLCHPDLPYGPVALADQDDLWLPTHLSRGLTALSHQPAETPQAYVAHRLLQQGAGIPRPMPWRGMRRPTFRNALVENVLSGSGLILSAPAVSLVRRHGLADVPFWDWWLYLLFTGTDARIHHDRVPGVIYRAHKRNEMGPRHGMRARLWRLRQVHNGTYRRWIHANLAALEPHMDELTPEAQTVLEPLLPQPSRSGLRALCGHRRWPQDRLALWLGA